MIEPYKAKSTTGAKKAAGQLSKVLQMLGDDAYCMDIIQQVRAVEGLLDAVSSNILESHLHTCACKALGSKNNCDDEKIIKEIITAFKSKK